MSDSRSAGADPESPAPPRRRVPERRGGQRYPARRIAFRSSQVEASLIDVSDGGLAIESLEHPPIGATLIFALEQGPSRVDTDGQVRWCNLKRTYRTAAGDVVPVYRAGIRVASKHPRLLDSIVRSARRDWVAGTV